MAWSILKHKYFPTVEIPMFLMFFCATFSGPVNTNLMRYRTCYYLLEHNKTECAMLGHKNNTITQALELEVQPRNNQISLTSSMTESVLAIIISLMLGPWSDKFGRRPVFILNTTANVIGTIFGLFFTYFEDMSPWLSLVGGIPNMLSGGTFAFIAVANSYVTEVTDDHSRGLRVGIFAASVVLGNIVGSMAGGFLMSPLGYMGVATTALVVSIISWLYTFFCLSESLKNPQTENIVRGFFDMTNFIEMYETMTKKRKYRRRAILLLLTIANAFCVFVMAGDQSMTQNFTSAKFGWSTTHYSFFIAAQFAVSVVVTIAGMVLFERVLKWRESIASTICFTLCLCGVMISGLATKDYLLYIVPFLRGNDGLLGPLSVTCTTKIVDKDELGKVLSGMIGARFLISLIGSPLYTVVYNATIKVNPSYFNFMSAALYVVSIIMCLTIVYLENTNPPDYAASKSEMEKDAEQQLSTNTSQNY